MKKYCLTDCAKEKLSIGKEVLIESITAVLFVIAVFTILMSVSLVTGLVTQGTYVYITGSLIGLPIIDPFTFGVTLLVVLTIIAVVMLLTVLVLHSVYKTIKSIVTNSMRSKYNTYECRVFKECT